MLELKKEIIPTDYPYIVAGIKNLEFRGIIESRAKKREAWSKRLLTRYWIGLNIC